LKLAKAVNTISFARKSSTDIEVDVGLPSTLYIPSEFVGMLRRLQKPHTFIIDPNHEIVLRGPHTSPIRRLQPT